MQAAEIELKFPVADPAALEITPPPARLPPRNASHLRAQHSLRHAVPRSSRAATRSSASASTAPSAPSPTSASRTSPSPSTPPATRSASRPRPPSPKAPPSPRSSSSSATLPSSLREVSLRVVAGDRYRSRPTSSSTRPPSAPTPNSKAHRVDRPDARPARYRPRHLPHRQLRQALPRLEAAHRQPRRTPHLRRSRRPRPHLPLKTHLASADTTSIPGGSLGNPISSVSPLLVLGSLALCAGDRLAANVHRAVVSRVSPVYPELAHRMHVGGKVVLLRHRPAGRHRLQHQGRVRPRPPRAAAEDAVRRWRFAPDTEASESRDRSQLRRRPVVTSLPALPQTTTRR